MAMNLDRTLAEPEDRVDLDVLGSMFGMEPDPIARYRESFTWDDHVDPFEGAATIDGLHLLAWDNENEVVS